MLNRMVAVEGTREPKRLSVHGSQQASSLLHSKLLGCSCSRHWEEEETTSILLEKVVTLGASEIMKSKDHRESPFHSCLTVPIRHRPVDDRKRESGNLESSRRRQTEKKRIKCTLF